MGFLIFGFVLGLIAAGILYAAGSPWRREEEAGRRASQEALSNQAARLLKERNELAYDLEKAKHQLTEAQKTLKKTQNDLRTLRRDLARLTPKKASLVLPEEAELEKPSLSEIISNVERDLERQLETEESF